MSDANFLRRKGWIRIRHRKPYRKYRKTYKMWERRPNEFLSCTIKNGLKTWSVSGVNSKSQFIGLCNFSTDLKKFMELLHGTRIYEFSKVKGEKQ